MVLGLSILDSESLQKAIQLWATLNTGLKRVKP